MPFFSVIIPTFNADKSLQRCLISIIDQTDSDIEIIIQDGKSTDNTQLVARNIGDDRIKIFSEPDSGIYDAMNKAIARSSGTWLLFLGSDDYLFNSAVLADMRNELSHVTARLVYGDVKMAGDTPWAKSGTVYRGETPLPELLSHNYSHQAVFYHRQVFDDGHRYKTPYRICADYDFNLLCTAKYKVCYVPVIVSVFVGGGVSSVQDDPAFAKDKWMNTIRYFGNKLKGQDFAPFKKAFKNAAKGFLAQRELSLAYSAYALYLRHKFGKRKR